MNPPLRDFAQRARHEPILLGYLLEGYAQREALDDAALADRLGCNEDMLMRLRICGMPREEPTQRREDVFRIAQSHGLDPLRLFDVIKQAIAMKCLQEAAISASTADLGEPPPIVLAARDRAEDSPP
jgi:hypothetical protein